MKHFQKLAIALLVVCAATFTACSGSGKNALKDGVYMQSSGGHNGLVTLKTVVKDGKITDITTVESSETKGLGQEAINLLCRSMTENNSIRVDSVTGATVSSNCVKRIMQETLKQAGASDKAIQAMPEVRARPLADKTSYDYDVVSVPS